MIDAICFVLVLPDTIFFVLVLPDQLKMGPSNNRAHDVSLMVDECLSSLDRLLPIFLRG